MNKQDKANVHYRVIIARVPKAINGTVVTHNNMTIFQDVNNGTCGCRMVLPLDKDIGVDAYSYYRGQDVYH